MIKIIIKMITSYHYFTNFTVILTKRESESEFLGALWSWSAG